MSAPWAPPPRPERMRAMPPMSAEDRARLAGVLERLGWLEAELDFLEEKARAGRRRFWLAFVAGLALALVLL